MRIIRIRSSVIALLAALLLGGAGCSKKPPPQTEPPYESLLMLLADFRRFSEVDLYRQDPPLDLSGQNVFRATLTRLDYFEKSNPATPKDITNYARAQALARLGDFAAAIEAFDKVTDIEGSTLAPRALERIEQLRPLRDATATTIEDIENLNGYFKSLERKQKLLTEIAERHGADFDGMLAWRELEAVDVEYALALFRYRDMLKDGVKEALGFLDKMIARHEASRMIYAHHLMKGVFLAELARDLATLWPPDRQKFDSELYHRLANQAREKFQMVALADGYEEKLEAKALLEALDAFSRKVRKFER